VEEHEVTEGTRRVTVEEHEVNVKEHEELLWRNTK